MSDVTTAELMAAYAMLDEDDLPRGIGYIERKTGEVIWTIGPRDLPREVAEHELAWAMEVVLLRRACALRKQGTLYVWERGHYDDPEDVGTPNASRFRSALSAMRETNDEA